MGRDSSVGVATRYGLDVPGIECLCGPDFRHPSRPDLTSTSTLLYNECRAYLPLGGGGKEARDVNHNPLLAPSLLKKE
jgi:hypothetical protein